MKLLKSALAGLAILLFATLAVFGNNVLLQWSASADNIGVAGYNIYRNGVKIGSSPTTHYTDVTAQPGTTYNYTVTAVDASNNESGQSTVASITTAGGGTGGDAAFVLPTGHSLKFMSPTGSDGNDGSAPDDAHAWLSPNHPVSCGDIILAKPSTAYGDHFQTWGAVSNCPSTTGGIDGAGGIYVATLLCAGGSPGDCAFNSTSLGSGPPPESFAFQVGRNNWSIQGWKCSTSPTSSTQNSCFVAAAFPGSQDAPIVHHIAFINNIATNSGMGFATADGGQGQIPGNGVDQWAVVGNIVHNSNSYTLCIGAVDDAGPANFNNDPGTHVFIAGNFVMNNQELFGCGLGDGEGIFFDTWDAHNYTGQGVISDNVVWTAERMGIALFHQNSHGAYAGSTIKIYNNTVYNVNLEAHTSTDGSTGAINANSTVAGWPFTTSVFNNIVLQPNASNIAGGSLYAMQIGNTTAGASFTVGGSGLENIFKGQQTSCNNPQPTYCDPGFNVRSDANPYTIMFSGANFYGENPLFANAADLTTNWIGSPNCSGFANVAACMGWNYGSQTSTALMPVADIKASSTHSAGKGYQPPGPCVNSGQRFTDYPAWLKGIVYLHADNGFTSGTTITQKAGLITKPCNK